MSVYEYVPTRDVRRLKKRADDEAARMRAKGYELLPVHLQRYITALGGPWRLAKTGVKFESSAGRERGRLVQERWVPVETLNAALVLERLEQERVRELVIVRNPPGSFIGADYSQLEARLWANVRYFQREASINAVQLRNFATRTVKR